MAATTGQRDDERVPYRLPFPPDAAEELLVPDALADDERLWVPQSESVCFRPLVLHVSQGWYVNLLRVRRAGLLNRHRHVMPVTGYVLRGSWRYLEHDWVATPGAFLYEPPGETHTLVVDEGVEEMITLFHVNGPLVYVDPDGNATGYDDVFTKLERARAHYAAVGLGAGYVDRFIR